ncbi:hypothetical protein NMG60_11032608 [Bertholletia excelsa]
MPSANFVANSVHAHDVFLGFRGEDTRKTFTDHLHTALENAGFRTFRDDDGIRRGEDIKTEINLAIKGSKISIVVFSDDYASSRWCLDELVIILEHKRSSGHVVLPVFYHVDPLEVQNQTGTFGEGFARLEERLKGELGEEGNELMEKLEAWRAALEEVADLKDMFQLKQDDG